MLVLSRYLGERIVIDNKIVIEVVSLTRDKVRIGIEAPREMPVHREEVQCSINGEPPPRRGRKGGAS
jgi:carbon storage regulator